MSETISTIETLPNELFLELFEYLPPCDLHRTFFNLNSRVNLLIQSLSNLHFILQEDWDNRPRSIPFFASQISTLVVKHDEHIDFSPYLNLRSLKLSMPTEFQCNVIQPAILPNLESLSISNFFFSDHSKQLCRLIFSSAFSRLRTCHLDRMTLDSTHSDSSPSLRQLTISPSTWKSNNYEQIIRACSNLTSLRIVRVRNLPFELSSHGIPLHRALRSLHMHFYSIGEDWYDHLKWLLSRAPNLQSLTILIDHNACDVEFPFASLGRLLSTHVPNLINLNTKVPLNRFLSEELHVMKRLHPLFVRVQFHGYISRDLNRYLLISSNK